MQFLFRGRSYWGGFCFPPDRTVCGPPPLEANLVASCKGSLVYKTYVWSLPNYYSLFIPSSLLPIHYFLFTFPIPHSHLPPPLSPIHPPLHIWQMPIAYSILHIPYCLLYYEVEPMAEPIDNDYKQYKHKYYEQHSGRALQGNRQGNIIPLWGPS